MLRKFRQQMKEKLREAETQTDGSGYMGEKILSFW